MREGSRSPVKRKLTVLEDGQVERGHGGVESGGGLEDMDANLGDEFEEVIQDGRAMKMRRTEDI